VSEVKEVWRDSADAS